MEQYMCRLFLTIFIINKISFASGRVFKSGTFKYLHRHPKLKSCAVEVLKENRYVGGRVRELTGVCEGLNHSWAINQTRESGYAYAKKQWVEESYIPPIELGDWHVDIPGVLGAGSKVEVTMTVDSAAENFVVELSADDTDSRYLVGFQIRNNGPGDHEAMVYDKDFEKRVDETIELNYTQETKIKITFLSLAESLMVLVDKTPHLNGTTLELATVKQIGINVDTNKMALKLHSFKFTGV